MSESNSNCRSHWTSADSIVGVTPIVHAYKTLTDILTDDFSGGYTKGKWVAGDDWTEEGGINKRQMGQERMQREENILMDGHLTAFLNSCNFKKNVLIARK